MKKKLAIKLLSLCAVMTTGFALWNMQPTKVVAEGTTVYVSSSGSDANTGTASSPYATINKALSAVPNGGVISLQDTVTVTGWSSHNKTATITGGGLDITALKDGFFINDHVTIENTTINSTGVGRVYAMGNTVTIGAGVSWTTEVQLFGGCGNSTVESTNLTVLSGTYSRICGGCGDNGTVLGNTNLYVGGNVNNTIDETNHDWGYSVFGGGYLNTIGGSTNVTFADNAKARYIYGGSFDGKTVANGTYLTVTGGKAMALYGGSRNADVGSGATTVISGGKFEQVFGGSESASVSDDVDLRILGGEVTRRIYAGSYNDGTDHKVNGKITLTLGDVDVSYASSNSDKGIYARSRYKGDIEDSHIVFATASSYEKFKDKVGGSDWGASYVMGSTSAADKYHYCTYEEIKNEIIQNCICGNSATATISIDKNISAQYTGKEICPVVVDCDASWEYEKPTVSYENNVNIGTAKALIGVGQVCVEKEFLIIDTPTVLGGSVRLSAPFGLRFQSKVSDEIVATGATFGTLVIPKSVLGENELTHSTALIEDIKQQKWATESVQQNNPKDYEEGYQYFNAVLSEIPEEHFDEVIVARSYVYANGVYYYSDSVERSIMQVASYAIQDGYTESILYDYVNKGLEGKTVTIDGDVELIEEYSGKLKLVGTNCVAVWLSSDESVLTIDSSGNIKGLRVGSAVVTAKIGNVIIQRTIVVTRGWTNKY